MKLVSDFKLVKDIYGEEIAVIYVGCVAINLTMITTENDFDVTGNYTERLVKLCLAAFWEYRESDVHTALRIMIAVGEYHTRCQIEGCGGCVLKSIPEIMETTENYDKILKAQSGITFRMYLDGMLSTQSVNVIDTQSYRDKFIELIENDIKKHDWISFSDGTMFHKTFTPEVKDGY